MRFRLYKYFINNFQFWQSDGNDAHSDWEILEEFKLRDMLRLLRGFGVLYVLNLLAGFLIPDLISVTYRLNYIIVDLAFLFFIFASIVFGIYKRQNQA